MGLTRQRRLGYHFHYSVFRSRAVPRRATEPRRHYSFYKYSGNRCVIALADKSGPRIVVMGVGNILLRDEGAGVRALERLTSRYAFPDNVECVDGAVQALALMPILQRSDHLILFDAVRGGGEPGQVYRFSWEEIPPMVRYKDSIHQIDFTETMSLMPLIGEPPQTVVIGVEPQDLESICLTLSPIVEASLDKMCRLALEELDRLGVEPIETDRIPGKSAI